jgi:RNA-dependent RNA polymerase
MAPADENDSTPRTLDENRGDATVEDICDFIVEYINSDVMVCIRHMLIALGSIFCDLQGLLADRHIIIADQSKVTCFL